VNTLQVPLKDFFEGMELPNGKDYLLVKASDQQALQKEDREGFDYKFILAQQLAPATMEVALLSVKAGAKSRATQTDGFEMKYILSGRCDYFIGEEKISLEEGDTLYFDASKPHMPVNRGPGPVVMLVVYLLTMR
jgi:mannose-6-phosphate isomerase-like protein (cupin superfamily)